MVTAIRCFKKSISTYLIANTGLAVGLTCVLLISYYIANQMNYDRDLPQADRIFRLDTAEKYPGRNPLKIARAPGPVGLAIYEKIPGIEAITRGFVGDISVTLTNQKIPEMSLVVDPNFLDEIQLPLLHGSRAGALASPDGVVISKEVATKHFGKTDVLGEKLTINRVTAKDYVVTGVMENLPENSHMAFDLLLPLESYFTEKEIRNIRDSWNGAYFHTYLRLSPNVSSSDIENKLPDFVDRNMPESLSRLLSSAPHDFFQFNLVQLKDIHLYGAPLASMKPPGNTDTIRNLVAVSIMTLLIAAFNFSILGTTQATLRVKEVAMRKTLGAGKRHIAMQFLSETFIQAFFIGLVAVGLSEILMPIVESQFGSIFGAYRIEGGASFLWLFILVTIVTPVAGLYPTLFVSRLRPAAIFNPASATPFKMNVVRGLMVILQISITAILVTVGATMFMQQRFIKAQETGYEADRIIVARIPKNEDTRNHIKQFMEGLKSSDNIEGVTISSAVPGDESENNLAIKIPGQEKPVIIGYHTVDERFLGLYAASIIAGRSFSSKYGSDLAATSIGGSSVKPSIVNRTAIKTLGYSSPQEAIGQTHASLNGDAYLIVGVVPDVRFRSFKETVRPELFLLVDEPGHVVTVKYTQSKLKAALDDLEGSWLSSFPSYPLKVEFLQDLLTSLYEEEDRNTNLIIAFAAIAMLLSCVGLVAILSFTINRQRRELAIRRLYGATTLDTLMAYASRFIKPILIANLLSWPISFYFLQSWLSGFETRIDLSITPFAFSSISTLVLAAILLMLHLGRIRATRPAEILRRE